jgi:hypothetical protein
MKIAKCKLFVIPECFYEDMVFSRQNQIPAQYRCGND